MLNQHENAIKSKEIRFNINREDILVEDYFISILKNIDNFDSNNILNKISPSSLEDFALFLIKNERKDILEKLLKNISKFKQKSLK